MKKIRKIVLILLVATALSGCGDKKETENVNTVPKVEAIGDDTGKESNDEPEKADDADRTDMFEKKEAGGEENGEASQDILHGDVLSIGDNSVVVNKVFTGEKDPNGNYVDSNTMVAFLGDEEQVKITVYFTDDTKYTLRKTWDNGAGGEDSSGSFGDIREGDLLDLRGQFEGEEFFAEKATIYRNMD